MVGLGARSGPTRRRRSCSAGALHDRVHQLTQRVRLFQFRSLVHLNKKLKLLLPLLGEGWDGGCAQKQTASCRPPLAVRTSACRPMLFNGQGACALKAPSHPQPSPSGGGGETKKLVHAVRKLSPRSAAVANGKSQMANGKSQYANRKLQIASRKKRRAALRFQPGPPISAQRVTASMSGKPPPRSRRSPGTTRRP